MKVFFLGLSALFVLSACRSDKPADIVKDATDSVAGDTSQTSTDEEEEWPVKADGLFDDFIYSFMRNRTFQIERIDFPLSNKIDGVDKPIAQKDWKFDPLYVKQDVYTMIFSSEKSTRAEKDTLQTHVVVEWVDLDKQRVKQYVFDKIKGHWRMTALDSHSLRLHPNYSFYEFYRRFSSDERYQHSHIIEPFGFKTYDYENFQYIDGLLDVEQWPDYRPDLPKGIITNINYGQDYAASNRRVFVICNPSGGMGCSMTFVQKEKIWMLERLEN